MYKSVHRTSPRFALYTHRHCVASLRERERERESDRQTDRQTENMYQCVGLIPDAHVYTTVWSCGIGSWPLPNRVQSGVLSVGSIFTNSQSCEHQSVLHMSPPHFPSSGSRPHFSSSCHLIRFSAPSDKSSCWLFRYCFAESLSFRTIGRQTRSCRKTAIRF